MRAATRRPEECPTRAELKAALVLASVGFVLIQVIPGVGRVNPTSRALTTPPPPEIHDVLKRACYDCHSNETDWPATSRVAPLAWAIESHVYGARAKMNLSFWPDDPHGQAMARRKIGEMVSTGRMPLLSYRYANAKGRLTDDEVRLLEEWAEAPVPAAPLKDAAMRGGQAAVVR
jgi:hypothetical protein